MKTAALKAIAVFAWLTAVAAAAPAQLDPREEIVRLLNRSAQWRDAGELEKAESDAREALGVALEQLGVLYAALGENDTAERAYREAIRASVRSSEAGLMGLSILDLRRGNYQQGIENISKILEMNPLHPGARHVLGKIRFMQGDFETAVSELQDSYQVRPDDTSVAYTLALTRLKLGRVEAARELFAELIQRLGDSVRLRMLFGRVLRATGYLDEAIEEFRKAIEMDPTAPRVHSYLGLTYLLQRDSAAYPDAIQEFERELRHHPKSYFEHFYLGIIYNDLRENEKAASHLRQAIEADPQNPDAWLHLGHALFQNGDFPGAAEAMSRCIQLTVDPAKNYYQVANAHFVRGRSLMKLGQRDEARTDLERAQELKSQRADGEVESLTAYIRGTVSRAAEQDTEALENLVEREGAGGILEEPDLDAESRRIVLNTTESYRSAAAKSCQSLARLQTVKNDYAAAAGYLRQALSWDESLEDGFYNLGLALLKAGDPARAVDPLIQAHKRADHNQIVPLLANAALKLVETRESEAASRAVAYLLEVNPQVAELWVLNGHVASQKGRFDEAVAHYREGLAKNPGIREAHYSIGAALIRQAEFEAALQEFEAELKLNPQHAGALYHKAYILLSRRQTAEATEILLRVVRLDPRYADAYYQLGKIQLERGETLLAVANLETAAHLSPAGSHIFYQLSQAYRKSNRMEEAEQAFQRYRALKKAEEEARLSRMRQGPPGF